MSKATQKHWDTIYETKNPDQVSWTPEVPKTSLDFIHSFHLKDYTGFSQPEPRQQ